MHPASGRKGGTAWEPERALRPLRPFPTAVAGEGDGQKQTLKLTHAPGVVILVLLAR